MDIHWRNTQKPVRFLMFDARAFIGVLFFLLHVRTWVFVLVAFSLIFFWALERRGLYLGAAMRAIRSWLLGKKRPANSRRARRRMIDYCGK
jgi:intracellular multiplication protein IcmT